VREIYERVEQIAQKAGNRDELPTTVRDLVGENLPSEEPQDSR
jgi:hypothetical protein